MLGMCFYILSTCIKQISQRVDTTDYHITQLLLPAKTSYRLLGHRGITALRLRWR